LLNIKNASDVKTENHKKQVKYELKSYIKVTD